MVLALLCFFFCVQLGRASGGDYTWTPSGLMAMKLWLFSILKCLRRGIIDVRLLRGGHVGFFSFFLCLELDVSAQVSAVLEA